MMMNFTTFRLSRPSAAVSILALVACASREPGSDAAEHTGSSSLPLTLGATPVPVCQGGSPCWTGQEVELLFADALAECAHDSQLEPGAFRYTGTGLPPTPYEATPPFLDNYAEAAMSHMTAAMCDGSSLTFAKWVSNRANPVCNRDPLNASLPATADVHPVAPSLSVTYTLPSDSCEFTTANPDLRFLHWAATNACVATRLRDKMTTSGTLLLSGAQQRELLEVIRERSQISLLSYARIGVAVHNQTPVGAPICAELPNTVRRSLSKWIDSSNAQTLQKIGRDIQSTLGLYVAVASELSELLARSASARAPTGIQYANAADEAWGRGSWRQRLQALTYGGDPLSSQDKLSPSSPAAWYQTAPVAESWPNYFQQPYVRTPVRSPQADQFYSLLTECDYAALRLTGAALPSGGLCAAAIAAGQGAVQYREVEACIRARQCSVQSSGTCLSAGAIFPSIPVPTDYSDFELWKQYRVRPEDAQASADVLAEVLGTTCLGPSGTRGDVAQPHLPGPMSASGALQFYGGGQTLIEKAVQPTTFEPRFPGEIQRQYIGLHRMRLLSALTATQWTENGSPADTRLGLWHNSQGAAHAEQERLTGVAPTLAALREVLIDSGYAQPKVRNQLFGARDSMLRVIDGVIGKEQVSVKATIPSNTAHDVRVMMPADDVFYVGGSSVQHHLVVQPFHPSLSSLAIHTGATVNGADLAALLAADAFVTETIAPDVQTVVGASRFLLFRNVAAASHSVLLVRRTETVSTPNGTLQQATYRFLSILPAQSPNADEDQYFVFGGSLINKVAVATSPDTRDASRPATDAFGFPTRWVPPTTASLSNPTQSSSVDYYLGTAKQAAQAATEAVAVALQAIVDQGTDDGAQQAATIKSDAVAVEQKKSLCGNSSCDLGTTSISLDADALWPGLDCTEDVTAILACLRGTAAGTCANFSPATATKCLAKEVLRASTVSVVVSTAVAGHLNDPAPPSFDEFAGGRAQTVLLGQWNAHRQVKLAGDALVVSVLAAEAKLEQMQSVILAHQEEKMIKDCGEGHTRSLVSSFRKAGDAAVASKTTGVTAAQVGTIAGGVLGVSFGGPLGGAVGAGLGGSLMGGGGDDEKEEAAKRRCQDAMIAMEQIEVQIVNAGWDTISSITSASGSFTQRVVDLRVASASLLQLKAESELAVERAKVDASLAKFGAKTQYGVYRKIHQYDVWRAQALLDAARRQAVIARKAIEAKYLVNLSEMQKDEPLVAAPSKWADEIYEYDLSISSAVGLSVGGTQPGGVAPNKLVDYIGNLERFVEGFPIARPTAVAHDDSEVLEIPGPGSTELRKAVCSIGDGGIPICPVGAVDKLVPTPRALSWMFLCNEAWHSPTYEDGDTLKPCSGDAGIKPTVARVTFRLDPWGRVQGTIADEPYLKRYNARWQRLAINLVGTGLLDCTKAKDPSACYAQPFLRFNLQHSGNIWTQDHQGDWRQLVFPEGRIEGGKALAAEQWVDPITNGWAKPFIQAAQRHEFSERPFQGFYTLDVQLGPEARIERLERVQVLSESSYWVKQNLRRSPWLPIAARSGCSQASWASPVFLLVTTPAGAVPAAEVLPARPACLGPREEERAERPAGPGRRARGASAAVAALAPLAPVVWQALLA